MQAIPSEFLAIDRKERDNKPFFELDLRAPEIVVPSTWNCSPRDMKGQQGPYESALMGTPIADETRPLEVLRTIHSFDPCMACGVHLLDADGNELTEVHFDPAEGMSAPILRIAPVRE